MPQQFRIIAGMLSDKAAFLHCNSLTFFRLGILFSVVSRLMFTSMPVTGNNSKVMFACPAQCRPISTLECGAGTACSRSAIFNFALHQEQASCPEGSEHRASSLRMAPEGPVAPSGPPRPDLNSRGLSEQFRSRTRLRRLLVRLRRPTLQRSLRSLRQRGFVTIVPRYFAAAK